jgi:anthranilate synthase component I
MKYNIEHQTIQALADTLTPIGVYTAVRDRFARSILLESADYHGHENSVSYICCDPLATFECQRAKFTGSFPDGSKMTGEGNVLNAFDGFIKSFTSSGQENGISPTGFFGYTTYDAVEHFEEFELKERDGELPEMHYTLFRFVIALDHFRDRCYITENYVGTPSGGFDEFVHLVRNQRGPIFPFRKKSGINSPLTDEQVRQMVDAAVKHCLLGDVFQLVLSRPFEVPFSGDELQVYRALRSVNPSPYLFYFDLGKHKLFGSSPEAQLVVKNGQAKIHPIAGTFRRTGDDAADAHAAAGLLEDPKENAEHVMLVDLARNDLSRFCENVSVTKFREIQYYSHVIHLVSEVSGKIRNGNSGLDVFAATFPAGTLSGAPKFKAMQLISEYEQTPRGYYGGAIGFFDLNGNSNHAIMIRTFMSRQNRLHFQAGAGIVVGSDRENEKNEINNKVGALKAALELAETI